MREYKIKTTNMNTKYLKPKQKKLIKDLSINGRIINVVTDMRTGKTEATLSDEDLNDYYDVPIFRLTSLINRGIIKPFSSCGSFEVDVVKFKLNQ